MILTLRRHPSADGATIGELFVDGQPECFTLEDVIRPAGVNVPGQTAIPPGRYRIVVNMSRRFARRLPLLLDVPGFKRVRIHPGNTSSDTEGCILVGRTEKGVWIGQSRLAFDTLFPRIDAACGAGETWIEIINPTP